MDKTKLQAILLIEEVWKKPDVVGSSPVNGLIYKLEHGQVVKFKDGQIDIGQLPTAEFSIVKEDQHVAHSKSGDVYVKMSYSGDILEAYGDVAEDGQQSRYDLSPEEAVKVAQEVWKTVQSNHSPTA